MDGKIMMRSWIVLLFVFSLTLSQAQTKFSDKVGGHVYTMSIPDYMVKTYELNDVATLQYQNSSKEAYIVVIEDAKDQLESLGMKFTSANNFLEEFIKDYKTDNDNRAVKNNLTFKASGNDCAQLELYWTEDETDFFMLITAIETKTHFYKILNWTITDNVKTLKNDFQAIAKSLRD